MLCLPYAGFFPSVMFLRIRLHVRGNSIKEAIYIIASCSQTLGIMSQTDTTQHCITSRFLFCTSSGVQFYLHKFYFTFTLHILCHPFFASLQVFAVYSTHQCHHVLLLGHHRNSQNYMVKLLKFSQIRSGVMTTPRIFPSSFPLAGDKREWGLRHMDGNSFRHYSPCMWYFPQI